MLVSAALNFGSCSSICIGKFQQQSWHAMLQGLSSLLWGLSQLGVKPEAPLLPAVASHMEQNLFRFGPQVAAHSMPILL